ncbi:hypothetical protein [Pseudomonas sp. BN411]|uniref:fimbrial protein n=1 Tax=Pseudomonas sp. BN411 TaxID=2567887 RepID=UPI002454B625|nr:hypothetical protein [Pseudomonas sp. BN411]MDH4560581.1 type 1 fimbrial protein [Pseudomonas sp. BN411]
MLFTRLSLAALLAAAGSQPALAGPNSGIIQFEGEVLASTCTISVNGEEASNPVTVTLEDVLIGEVFRKRTDFSIDVADCPSSVRWVYATFKAANGGTVTDGYYLDNLATLNPAKHVWLEFLYLRDGSSSEGWVRLDGQYVPEYVPDYLNLKDGAARMRFIAKYSAPYGGLVTVGSYEGAVEVAFRYN